MESSADSSAGHVELGRQSGQAVVRQARRNPRAGRQYASDKAAKVDGQGVIHISECEHSDFAS